MSPESNSLEPTVAISNHLPMPGDADYTPAVELDRYLDIQPIDSYQPNIVINKLKKPIAVALVGALAFTGCSGGSSNESTSTANNADKNGEVCEAPIQPSKELADEHFGSKNAIFPSLADKNGDLVDKEEAVDITKEQVAGDQRVAAVMASLYNARDDKVETSKMSPQNFLDEYEAMGASESYMTEETKSVCNNLNFLEKQGKVAIVGGEAVIIGFSRDKKGVESFMVEDAKSNGTYEGFALGFNRDDSKLSDEQKAFYEDFENKVLILPDGRILIKGFPKPKTEQQDIPKQKRHDTRRKKAEKKKRQQQGRKTQEGGGGHFGPSTGKGESDQPGHVPESGGHGGYTPGTVPSYGPGGGQPGHPGTTPGTTPPHTTPPTTRPPHTTPPTTRPPHTTPPTTVPTTKPPQPDCDPNLAEVC